MSGPAGLPAQGVYEGVPVKCAGCGGWFHELTAAYSPHGLLHGGCLRLVQPYRDYGWYDFPHDESTVGDNLLCPQCMYPYRHESVARQAEAWLEKLRGNNGGIQAMAGETGDGRTEIEGNDDESSLEKEEQATGEDEVIDEGPPEKIGGLEAPVSGCSCDDRGVVADSSCSSGVVERVRKLVWEGKTQAQIAEICQISVYRVRQIQNGEGV